MSAKNIPQYIKTFVDNSSTHLMPYIAQGKFNNEFIRGRQNKRINPQRLTIEDKKEEPAVYIERKIFNRLLPIYLYRYGLLTQNMPIPGIKPIRNTSKEVSDAKKVNDYILSFMADKNFKKDYQKAIKHADVYGIEWFKTGIDWTEGNEICEIETTIGETKGKMLLREGKAYISAVPMHEIFVDSLHVETIDDVNELVHRRAFSVDYIKKRWGVEVQRENIAESRLPVYPRFSNLGYTNAGDIDYAYVYEYYKAPDAVYPEGRYVIMCDKQIIWDSILPYVNAENNKRVIPFDFFNMQSVPHHMIGVTVYSQLIPIQETYNAIKNRYLEYVNHIAIGQVYYWEGSLINKNAFTTKPGKMIGLKRNARNPVPVQKDKLSMEFINYLRALEDDMLITAGLSQMAAYGTTKSNVRTDGVANKLSESDENKLVNALDNISECMIGVFKKIIYLEQQRQKMLFDQLKVANVQYTLRYDMSDVNPEKLTIVNREFLMQSDQAIEKKLQQIMDFGMFNPESQMSYTSKIELLNSLRANFLVDTLDPVERATHDLCDEEHAILFEGGTDIPKAEPFHVHAQHIVEHNLFRISPEVRNLAKVNPKQYKSMLDAIDMHIKEHEKFQQQKQESNVYANAKAGMSTPQRGQGSNPNQYSR